MAKILTIDDSGMSRRIVSDILSSAGHEVETARNGQEGLDKIKVFQPDAVVCDLLMPVMCGQEFLRNLRELGDATPVVIASADVQKSSKDECINLGICSFLNKPIKDAELIQAVHNALRNTVGV